MDKSNIVVLIVDDEEDLAEICAESFELEDYQVAFRLSGEEALDFFNEHAHVHVVVSDSHMPGMKGMELFEAIKKSDKPMPLFYLCTGDIELSEEELRAKGITGLVNKPFSLDDLIARVAKDLETI